MSEDSVALHEDCEEVLKRVAAWGTLGDLTVDQARRLEERRLRELGGPFVEVDEVRDVIVPGPVGDVDARVYRPVVDAPAGILVWLHGGGWTTGSPALSDDQTRALAQSSGCVVVSVDYRLAPEDPFPAGPEDCYAAVRWAAEHRDELGAPGAGLAVGGDSAGGNLTAAVTLMARDRGGPPIDFQLLVYPATCRVLDTASRREFAEGYWLTADEVDRCWNNYLAGHADGRHHLVSPLLAGTLAGLPPAMVITAECDVLRDEGELYAERLGAAGVPATVRRYEGMLHGFMACAGVVAAAWDAFDEAGRAVRDALIDARVAPRR